MVAKKLRCLHKLFFIRDAHTKLFTRFHQSTQKFLCDYTTGPGLLRTIDCTSVKIVGFFKFVSEIQHLVRKRSQKNNYNLIVH